MGGRPIQNVTKAQTAKVFIAFAVIYVGMRFLNDAGYQFEVMKDSMHLQELIAIVQPKIFWACGIMFCGLLGIVGAVAEALPKRATRFGRVVVNGIKAMQFAGAIALLAFAAVMAPVYGTVISLSAAVVAIGWSASVVTSKPPGVQVIGCGTEHDG